MLIIPPGVILCLSLTACGEYTASPILMDTKGAAAAAERFPLGDVIYTTTYI